MKIIIIDDNDIRRVSLVNYLIKNAVALDSEIAEANCIDSAKYLLRASYFDALILDVVLPKRAGAVPSHINGLNMLGQLTRSSIYKKPENIIGITAHIDDISRFKSEFDKYCFTVIEANNTTIGWKSIVLNSLLYTSASKLSRSVTEANTHALTIHGIRTFGNWQLRLKALVESRVEGIQFHSYKYGYFPIFDYLVPVIRNFEVKILARHLVNLFDLNQDKEFVIFSHSFGTYLIAKALQICIAEGRDIPVRTLVLCGSVLHEKFDWSFLKRKGVRIVNDCADSDYVLYLSKLLVLDTGMAGRSGFHGFQDESGINRFFLGGHSSYFQGDSFMRNYWLPLFDSNEKLVEVDCRKSSIFKHEFFDKLVAILSLFKKPGYIFILGLIVVIFIKEFF